MLAGSRRPVERHLPAVEKLQMESVQAYIGLRGNPNVSEVSDVPCANKQELYEKTVWSRVHKDIRINKTKWVVLRWPTASMAQMAEMSTESFEDYFFDVSAPWTTPACPTP